MMMVSPSPKQDNGCNEPSKDQSGGAKTLRTDEPALPIGCCCCHRGTSSIWANIWPPKLISCTELGCSHSYVTTEELVPFGQIFGHQSLSISCTKLGRVNDQDLKKSLALSTLSPKFVMHASRAVPTLLLSWCPWH